jgi:hypothetical protein
VHTLINNVRLDQRLSVTRFIYIKGGKIDEPKSFDNHSFL